MGDNFFSSREQSLENSAQAAYQASYDETLRKAAEAKEKAASVTDMVKGLTEPIGGILAGKQFEKVVTEGFRKLTGKAGKALSDKVTGALKAASNGDLTSFAKKAGAKTQQSIKDVLSDAVPDNVKKSFGKLSSEAQNKINAAREKLGKKKISPDEGGQPEPVEPDVESSDLSQVSNVKATTTADIDPADSALEEQDLNDWLNDAPGTNAATDYSGFSDPHGLRLGQGIARDTREPLPKFDRDLADREFEADAGLDQEDAFELALKNDADANAAAKAQTDVPATDNDDTDPNSSEQPDADHDADPNSDASKNAEDTDKTEYNEDDDKPDKPDDDADIDADVGDEGLEGAAEFLGDAALVEGGSDVFADVAAGVTGLAALIFGNEYKAPVQKTENNIVSSGIQYGI